MRSSTLPTIAKSAQLRYNLCARRRAAVDEMDRKFRMKEKKVRERMERRNERSI